MDVDAAKVLPVSSSGQVPDRLHHYVQGAALGQRRASAGGPAPKA
jgi:hypothetical protein